MKRILLAVLLLVMLPALAAPPPKGQAEFTREFGAALSQRVPGASFKVVGKLHLHAGNIGGQALDIFLDNAYRAYASGERSFNQLLDDRVASLKAGARLFAPAETKALMPIIKSRDYMATAKRQVAAAGHEKTASPFVYAALNDELYVVYVVDTPQSMRFLSGEEMKKLGLDRRHLNAVARKNLNDYLEHAHASFGTLDTHGRGRIVRFVADDVYESSALLTGAIWDAKRLGLQGQGVAFVPARNILLLVGSEDAAALKLARQVATELYSGEAYSISPHGYTYRGGRIVRFAPAMN